MVDLTQFFVGPAGVTERLQIKYPFWITIGSGSFSEFSPQSAAFSGNYDALGQQGTFSLAIQVSDDSNCVCTLNGTAINCTYVVNSDVLTVNIPSGPQAGSVQIQPGGGGTYISCNFPGGHYLWVGP